MEQRGLRSWCKNHGVAAVIGDQKPITGLHLLLQSWDSLGLETLDLTDDGHHKMLPGL